MTSYKSIKRCQAEGLRTSGMARRGPLGHLWSALMRSSHHLHGVLDMTPLPCFLSIAFALASHRILGCLGDCRQAMLLQHLSRDGVNLHLGYHPALLEVSDQPPPSERAVHQWRDLQTREPMVSFPGYAVYNRASGPVRVVQCGNRESGLD